MRNPKRPHTSSYKSPKISVAKCRTLISAAKEAAKKAYAPYSGLAIGAAVLAANGDIFTGCNVENASYGLTVCAERVAIFRAISEGVRVFTALGIFPNGSSSAMPCGACRQVISEFAPQCLIVLSEEPGKSRIIPMSKLLPEPFSLPSCQSYNLTKIRTRISNAAGGKR